ncbi:MAG: hypothetical protein H9W81_05090 [Enterococcus sp.]|nr:hypothetical protein [Enterococcus sp.]
MVIQLTPVPEIAFQRFADGWPAYDIPAVWVKPVEKWTVKLAEVDPDFTYEQITVKFDNQARVHIKTNPANYGRFRALIDQMNQELSDALPRNNRSY